MESSTQSEESKSCRSETSFSSANDITPEYVRKMTSASDKLYC